MASMSIKTYWESTRNPWIYMVTLNLINNWNGRYLTIIGLFTFSYSILQKYFSTLLGLEYQIVGTI